MDKIIAKLITAKDEKISAMESMIEAAEDRDFDESEDKAYAALEASCASIDKKVARQEALLTAKANRPVTNKIVPDEIKDEISEDFLKEAKKKVTLPSMGRYLHKLKCFTDEAGWKVAYSQGQMLMAILGSPKSIQWCSDHGLTPEMIHNEGINTQGGYLVLPEFDANVVKLELQYGVFEPAARNVPMRSDQIMRDRKTGGLTMFAVGESEAITESTMSWDQFEMNARKWGFLTRITNELSADSIINIMDELAQDVARASAKKKDEAGFTGTGTSAFHGITGINQKLVDINGVDEGGSVILASGDLMSEVDMGDFERVIGISPDFPGITPVWYCSKLFWSNVMQRLAIAAGGNTTQEFADGAVINRFMGFPVQFSEVFPKTDTTSQILCLFGDIDMSSDFGDRQATTIATSDSATVGGQGVFERDQLAIRWTERWDINNHDLGTATVAGPVIGLISAAS